MAENDLANISKISGIERRAFMVGGFAMGATALLDGCTNRSGRDNDPVAGRSRSGRVPGVRRLPQVDPVRANDFIANCGVGVHFNFRTSVYGNTSAVVEYIKELGVGFVRTAFALGQPEFLTGVREVASNGQQVNATCGSRTDAADVVAVIGAIHSSYINDFGGDAGRMFRSLEGINEPNNDGVPRSQWVSETRTMQTALYEAMKGDSRTDSIPILFAALADSGRSWRSDYAALGDCANICDWGTMHLYPQGFEPSHLIDRLMKWVSLPFPDKPIACTEGGYSDDLRNTTRGNPVPQDVVALYTPRHWLEHALRTGDGSNGNAFVRYELLDDPLPPGARDSTRRESSFGLIACPTTDPATWETKPSFTATANLMNLLADPGPPFLAAPLAFQVTGSTNDYRWYLMQKRDGVYYLAVWRSVSSWNPYTRTRMTVERVKLTVSFAIPKPVTLYIPNDGTAGSSRGRVSSLHIFVGAELQVLRIG